METGPAAIGLIGNGVSFASMRWLAYDLGAVLVTSGRRTLVVDATGLESDEESAAGPGPSGGVTVGEMLNPWQAEANGDRAMEAVGQATTLWPGLSAIASGAKSLYSVEGAMTPAFGKLIQYARDAYALTIVPVADRGGALAEAFVRNLDAVVVVGRGGRTKLREAERLLETFRAMGKPVLGTLLIVRPERRRLRELLGALFHREVRSTVATAPDVSIANGSMAPIPSAGSPPVGATGERHEVRGGEKAVNGSSPSTKQRRESANGATGKSKSERRHPAPLPAPAGTEPLAEAVTSDDAPTAVR